VSEPPIALWGFWDTCLDPILFVPMCSWMRSFRSSPLDILDHVAEQDRESPTHSKTWPENSAYEISEPSSDESPRSRPATSGRSRLMEVSLGDSRRARVDANVDAAALARVLDALDRR
jgi:hypothetical protein